MLVDRSVDIVCPFHFGVAFSISIPLLTSARSLVFKPTLPHNLAKGWYCPWKLTIKHSKLDEQKQQPTSKQNQVHQVVT